MTGIITSMVTGSKLARIVATTFSILIIVILSSGSSAALAQIFDQSTAAVKALTNNNLEKFLFATGNEVGMGGTPGEVICIGGYPVGGFCSPGTKQIHVRGATRSLYYTNLSGDAADMFDGVDTIVINCNWNENYSGPCWGTFEWSSNSLGGKWEGSYTAELDLFIHYVSVQMTGHGNGGGLEGLQMKADIVYPSSLIGTLTARVLTHKPR